MEPWLLAQNLLAIPLCIVTIISAIKKWPTLWDDRLTQSDRRLLLRISLAVLLPVVVFLHECGHALTTLAFGGTVTKFHFGFLWGEVISTGSFTDWQNLWIVLSGNVVQIDCGLIALLIASFSESPPVVALCVYLAFWSIAGTLIIYTGLSLFSVYGDWIAIYSSPLRPAVYVIGAIHVLAVVLIIWAVRSQKTNLWFARKTNPSMVGEERQLLETIQDQPNPSIESLLKLGWFYFRHDLPRIAQNYVHTVDTIDADNPEAELLHGWIKLSADDTKGAIERFGACVRNGKATNLQKVRGYLGAGFSQTHEVEKTLRGAAGSYEDWADVIALYECAIELDPHLGDPKFYRAELFSRAHLYNQALRDLSDAVNETFLDQSLATRAETNLEKLMASQVHSE